MKETGLINRASKIGAPLYCNRECAGAGRRVFRTASERQAAKAEYDRQRRVERGEEIRRQKREAYHASLATDAESVRQRQRAYRQANMARHVEYCRRPEYREQKQVYDQRRRDQQCFGDFAEAAAVLRDLETEISRRATRYEIYSENGTLNKALQRKRDYGKAVGC